MVPHILTIAKKRRGPDGGRAFVHAEFRFTLKLIATRKNLLGPENPTPKAIKTNRDNILQF
jgi:hypothetical protein